MAKLLTSVGTPLGLTMLAAVRAQNSRVSASQPLAACTITAPAEMCWAALCGTHLVVTSEHQKPPGGAPLRFSALRVRLRGTLEQITPEWLAGKPC